MGVDSIWKVSLNEMQFTNSLKMKMAVILGVVHMMFGLLIRLYNNYRLGKWVDFFTLTIPQLVFMGCTFVYMDFIIVYKWSREFEDSSRAPSIISTMIAIYVNMGKHDPNDPKDILFWEGERSFEKGLVAVAFICVPIMLLAKPLIIKCQRKNKKDVPLHDKDMI